MCKDTQTSAQLTHNMAISKRPICYAARVAQRAMNTPSKPPPTPIPEKNGRLDALLGKIKPEPNEFVDPDWRPIADLDNYVSYRRARATTIDEHVKIVKLINKHTKYYEENPVKEEVPSTRFIIPVRDSVSDVSGRMTPDPFATFMNKENTVDDYVEIYTKAGCSEDFIKRIRDAMANRGEDGRMRTEFLDKVLSKYSGKTTVKKKHVHIRNKFASLTKSKADIKEEDIE